MLEGDPQCPEAAVSADHRRRGGEQQCGASSLKVEGSARPDAGVLERAGHRVVVIRAPRRRGVVGLQPEAEHLCPSREAVVGAGRRRRRRASRTRASRRGRPPPRWLRSSPLPAARALCSASPHAATPRRRGIELARAGRGRRRMRSLGFVLHLALAVHPLPTVMRTLPTAPLSTAACAAGASSRSKRWSGSPACSPTRNAPSSIAWLMSAAAAVIRSQPTV